MREIKLRALLAGNFAASFIPSHISKKAAAVYLKADENGNLSGGSVPC